MYLEQDVVRIARRENNSKRGYLVINALQGKHIPVSPSAALRQFGALAELVKAGVAGERVLVVGFAETATAIGACIAAELGCPYIQTTRETAEGRAYLYFTEAHSHATEQKLEKEGLARALPEIGHIVFAEDELTTGNTILNLVEALEREFGRKLSFSAACLINGMAREAADAFQRKGIALYALLAADYGAYEARAHACTSDGADYCATPVPAEEASSCAEYPGRMDARGLVHGSAYAAACEALWGRVRGSFPAVQGKSILVLGTEEFMYPGLYLAAQMEQLGARVRFHATTRSPIAVSAQAEYPLHSRYQLKSLYDNNRNTFLYELCAYDSVMIVTDAPAQQTGGLSTLLAALRQAGNNTIHVVRWCDG